jgi:myo-inositol-1(or 4)-monophosphatase
MNAAPPAPDAALLAELRELAERAARAGGWIARRAFDQGVAVRLKPDRSEVTDVDLAAQQAVIDTLWAARPHDAIIAEEDRADGGPPAASAAITWAVDPLDGTRNYVRGIPAYACSVGALYHGVPVAGAIFEPQRDRLYLGDAAGGLTVNGRPLPQIVPSAASAGRNPKAVAAIPSSPGPALASLTSAWLERFVCRCFGATALHLAMVAVGDLDAALCDNARLWDIAAGCALLTAAGCPIARPDGTPLFPLAVGVYRNEELPLITANPRTWPALPRP